MFNVSSLPLLLIVSILISSCAASYKQINPSAISYPPTENDSMFSYKYNVLKTARNKKMAKKEDKTNTRIVAIKIINNTGQTLKYGHNYDIYLGNQKANILDPAATSASVKQTVPLYLLYLLLTPMRLTVSTPTKESRTPIGLAIGPGLAAINVAISASANKNFKTELINHSIIDREIKAGETFYGLIGITDDGYLPLTLKLSK